MRPAAEWRPRTPPAPAVRRLALVSLALWLASLALPAFQLEHERGPTWGAEALAFGVLLGWAAQGWAAYANLLFAVVQIRLWRGARPWRTALAMLALAALTPWFEGPPETEAAADIDPLLAWGWGAVAWIASLLLLALAVAAQDAALARRGRRAAIALGAALAALALGTSAWQHGRADPQERQEALSAGMAFMPSGTCGLPFAWPAAPRALVPEDETVALEIDPSLPADAVRALRPPLRAWQEGGHAWRTRELAEGGDPVTLREAAAPRRHALAMRAVDGGVLVELRDAQRAAPLFAQRLRHAPTAAGQARWCPAPPSPADGTATIPDVLAVLAGQGPRPANPARLEDDTLDQPCDPDLAPVDGRADLHAWDGRVVATQWPAAPLAGFCSATHVALVALDAGDGRTGIDARVYDRATLQPLARVLDVHDCTGAACGPASHAAILAVHLAGNAVRLQLPTGYWNLRSR